MKIRCGFCLVLCFFILISAFVVPTSADEADQDDQSVENGSHSLDALDPLMGSGKVVDNTKATILYEYSTGTLLQAWNADKRMYPASLVKIMTALLAVEKGTMTDTVTVRQGAFASLPSDAVSADLKAGEQISMLDLFYSLIVASANDSAIVIAEHIAGSQSAFVDMMNARAAELGCTNTNFVNCHGIHHDNQYTSARDIAKMLEEAMKYDLFRTAFGTIEYTIEATNLSEERTFVSNNFLIHTKNMEYYYDDRVTGGRAGVDVQGFRGVASTAEYNGMQVISVVLGCESFFGADGVTVTEFGGFQETTSLLNAGFDAYRKRQIVAENQILRQSGVLNGDCDLLMGSHDSISVILPYRVTLDDLTFRYTDDLEGCMAPISKGDRVSYLQVWYGPVCLFQADVYAMNDVPLAYQKVLPNNHKKDGLVWWQIVVIVAASLVVLTVIGVVGLRIYNIQKIKKFRKHKRQERR